ncbi:unnamed protein product [Amaranthus hypochondriacus]
MIGEKWGPVLSVNQHIDDVSCLTYAKMLVRTKAQIKVDPRVRLIFKNESCDVWVKECGTCVCHNTSYASVGSDKGVKSDGSNVHGTSKCLQVSDSLVVGKVIDNGVNSPQVVGFENPRQSAAKIECGESLRTLNVNWGLV